MMPTNPVLAKSVDALQSDVAEPKKRLSMFNDLYENIKPEHAPLTKENKYQVSQSCESAVVTLR